MIKFKNKDNSEQFISVFVIDKAPTYEVYEYISNIYPLLKASFYAMDNEEIIFNIIDGVHYGFSLNELREKVKQKAKAKITHFCVDLEKPNQRYDGATTN